MYPSTTGRFSATIGYVAPTPNHVRVHHVQQSKIRVPISYSANHEQNVPSRAPSRAQTPNPSNPAKGTPKGETHKGGPPLCPRNNTPTPLPTPGPKTRSRNPPSQPLPPGSAPHTATSASRNQNHPLPASLSHPRTRSWPNVSTQCHSTVFILAHPVPMTSS